MARVVHGGGCGGRVRVHVALWSLLWLVRRRVPLVRCALVYMCGTLMPALSGTQELARPAVDVCELDCVMARAR